MKLSSSQTASFLKNPAPSVRVFLFYGPDEGLVRERAETLAGKFVPDKDDPFAVCALEGDALGADAARLLDEMASRSLTGGRRLVRLFRAEEKNAGALGSFLESPSAGDSVLIVEAGDLPKKSRLRALCESASDLAAALPCYFEEAGSRQKTISSFLEKEGLSASRAVVLLLSELLPADHRSLQAEMEKLALYAKNQKTVNEQDVRAIIAEAAGLETDSFVEAMAGGFVEKTANLLDSFRAEQRPPVILLRAAQRHFTRLLIARNRMDQGSGVDLALKALSPPVFWKSAEPMKRQLSRWTSARLEKRLGELLEAEAAIKRTGVPDMTLCAQLFLNIAAKG